MQLLAHALTFIARKDKPVALACARGAVVRCAAGAVWVSVAGSSEDWVLSRGEECRIPSDGLALIEGFRDAEVTVSAGQGAAPRARLLLGSLLPCG